MNEVESKLIKAYKEYIDFLTKEYVEVFIIADAHGYHSRDESVLLGQQLRDKIHKLETESITDTGEKLMQNLRMEIDKSF
jgi:hypothetical protein